IVVSIGLILGLYASLPACSRGDPFHLSVATDASTASIEVTVENLSNHPIRVPRNILDEARVGEVQMEVADGAGRKIKPCAQIEYLHGPATTPLGAGEAATISIPLSALVISYCLGSGREYKLRAHLVDGVQSHVDRRASSAWITIVPASSG